MMIVISYKPAPKAPLPPPVPGSMGYDRWLANQNKKQESELLVPNNTKKLDSSLNKLPDFSNIDISQNGLKFNNAKMNIDGDIFEFEYEAGTTEIKHTSPPLTAEQNAAIKEYFELEKKYGITDDDGVVIREYVGEEIYELTGTIFQANLDDFIYAAHGRAEGLTYSSCNSIFDIRGYADKLLKFANRDMYGHEGRADKITQEERESLTNELYAIFDELAESIKQGDQLKVSELKGTFTLNGHKLTFADLFHIMDLCNATAEGHGGGFNNDTVGGFGGPLRAAYFITYAKTHLKGEAQAFALEYQQLAFNDNYQKYGTDTLCYPTQPGMEYYSQYAAFKDSYREDMYNILFSVDTSSEQAFFASIPKVVDQATSLQYRVMKMRGAWDSFANQCAQTYKKNTLNEVSKLVAFKDVKTEWRW